MRLIDVEPIERELFKRADKSLAKNPYGNAKICAFRRAFELVLTAPTIAPLPNDPLTLEQLLKMNWEPAWVDGDYETELGKSGWAILWYSKVEKYLCVWWPGEEYADIPALGSYGDTWTVYRHKPDNPAYAE